MSNDNVDNIWMVCLNCETNFSLEELFVDDLENDIECPVCERHSFRRCDDYGLENDIYFKEEEW